MPARHSQVYGARWDLTEAIEGAGERTHQATLFHLSSVLVNQGGPRLLEATQCNPHLQEQLEGESRELKACQSYLSTREGYGTDYLGYNTWHVQDSLGIRLSKHGFLKGMSCLTNLSSF